MEGIRGGRVGVVLTLTAMTCLTACSFAVIIGTTTMAESVLFASKKSSASWFPLRFLCLSASRRRHRVPLLIPLDPILRFPGEVQASSGLYLSLKKQACEVGSIPAPETAAGGVSDDGNRKVSRSRSVGCGSRRFSGDFFERISTGFGDCALRRVASQREGKPKATSSCSSSSMKERVKCGGIFGGFMILTLSSTSSYWVSSSATEDHINGKPTTTGHGGRRRSWGWTPTSPTRALTKPSSSTNKINNTTPNLSAIPSLLALTN